MSFLALVGLGFLGLAGGFESGGSSPLDPGVGDFNAASVRPLLSELRAPAGRRITVPIFKASDFPFVTLIPDDGMDKGGGWQEAKANLELIRVDVIPPGVTKWKCRVAIQMPLRTETMGKIPPSVAATMSAGITNMVTIGMDFELPQSAFCDTFVAGVKATFKATYPRLGSRVLKWR